MQNKKIQMWALGIPGYNCKIEYITGSENSCADLLSRVAQDDAMSQEKENVHDSEINDKAYIIGELNTNRFNPKEYARCTLHLSDTVEKPSL